MLNDRGVLDAMETAGEAGYRFLPLRVSKTSGDVTGEALATAEQFGKLGRHIQQVLEDICRELGQGAIAADPFWRGRTRTPAAIATMPPPATLRRAGGRLPPVGPQAGRSGLLDRSRRREEA